MLLFRRDEQQLPPADQPTLKPITKSFFQASSWEDRDERIPNVIFPEIRYRYHAAQGISPNGFTVGDKVWFQQKRFEVPSGNFFDRTIDLTVPPFEGIFVGVVTTVEEVEDRIAHLVQEEEQRQLAFSEVS